MHKNHNSVLYISFKFIILKAIVCKLYYLKTIKDTLMKLHTLIKHVRKHVNALAFPSYLPLIRLNAISWDIAVLDLN